jgi:hypothetical protein
MIDIYENVKSAMKKINIDSIDLSKVNGVENFNIVKVLLIFYVLISCNYTDKLMSKQLGKYISDNKPMQHFIGFLAMIVLINIVGGVNDVQTLLFYSIVAYIWFIFSTKLDIHWNLVIIVLLFGGYMYESMIIEKHNKMEKDPNITQKEKDKLMKDHNRNKKILFGALIAITIIGTSLYTYKKQGQYGGGYDFFVYMFN